MRKNLPGLAALSVCVFIVGTAEFLITGLLQQVAADLDVSIFAAGQVVTAYALGVVVGGPLVAIATVRLPRKGLMLGLMTVFAAGSALSAVAPDYFVLLTGRVISSLGHATFFALALIVATTLAPPGRAGMAIAAMGSGLAAATLLGMPLGALLGQHLGWRFPFAVLAVLALVGLALIALAVPRLPSQPSSIRSELAVLTRRPVILSIATTAVGFAGVGAVFTYITPLLTEISGFTAPAVSGLLLTYGVGSLLGNVIGGKFADIALGATLRWVFGALAVLLALLPLAAVWQPSAVVVVVAFGLLATATVAPLQSVLLSHAGAAPTLAVTVNVAAFMLAHAVGSVIGGGVVSVSGPQWTGLAGAGLAAGGLALSYLAVPGRTATPEHAIA